MNYKEVKPILAIHFHPSVTFEQSELIYKTIDNKLGNDYHVLMKIKNDMDDAMEYEILSVTEIDQEEYIKTIQEVKELYEQMIQSNN